MKILYEKALRIKTGELGSRFLRQYFCVYDYFIASAYKYTRRTGNNLKESKRSPFLTWAAPLGPCLRLGTQLACINSAGIHKEFQKYYVSQEMHRKCIKHLLRFFVVSDKIYDGAIYVSELCGIALAFFRRILYNLIGKT